MHKRLPGWIVVAVTLAAVFSPACVIDDGESGARGTFERTLDVPVRVRVEVRGGSGDVTISPGAAGKVHVRGDVRSGLLFGDRSRVEQVTANPPVALSGSLLRMGPTPVSNVSIAYTIEVPADAIVDVHAGSGDVQIHGVEGPVEVATGSGDIHVSGIRQSVKLTAGSGDITARDLSDLLETRTGSGDQEIDGVAGNLRLRASSGDIQVRRPGGRVDARTTSGTLDLRGAARDVRLNTSSGDCEVEGDPQNGALWEIDTRSGDVTLNMPSSASFQLHVLGRSRRLDIDASIVEEERSRNEFRGRSGSGDARVRVETSTGSVRVR